MSKRKKLLKIIQNLIKKEKDWLKKLMNLEKLISIMNSLLRNKKNKWDHKLNNKMKRNNNYKIWINSMKIQLKKHYDKELFTSSKI